MITSIIKALKTIDLKIEIAKQRIDSNLTEGSCVGHSGGKDSVIVHWLSSHHSLPVMHTAKSTGMNAIHPLTLDFIYSRPFPITYYPEGTLPPYSRQFDGTRASECERVSKSSDLIVDGKSINRKFMTEFNPKGLFAMSFVYPIYDWSDADVWAVIYKYRLPVSLEYAAELEILNKLRKLDR